jgi:hypothetical protein
VSDARAAPRGDEVERAAARASLWSAVGLAWTLAVPFAVGVGVLVVERVPEQSVLLFAGVAAAASALSAAMASTGLRTTPRGVVARAIAVVVVALGVRLAMPSPWGAIAAIRGGDEPLVTGVIGAAGVVVLLAMVVGTLLSIELTLLAKEDSSRLRVRAAQQRILQGWWLTLLGLAVVHFLTGAIFVPVVAAAVVLGAVAGVVLLADVGAGVPPIGALRPPLAAAPRSPARRGILGALAACGATLLVALPLLPTVPLNLADRLAGLMLDPEIGRRRRGPVDVPDFEFDEPPADPAPLLDLRLRAEELVATIPTWVGWVALVLVLVGLLAFSRPRRLLASLGATLLALVSGRWSRRRAEDDTELERAETVPLSRAGHPPRTGLLDRFRPRPRDPRRAIVHDYLRAERIFAKAELERTTGETPLEHGARVDGLRALPAARELAGILSTARYGRIEPLQALADRSHELVREIDRAAQLREGAPATRDG